jgi:hypothetical protein
MVWTASYGSLNLLNILVSQATHLSGRVAIHAPISPANAGHKSLPLAPEAIAAAVFVASVLALEKKS